MMCARKWLRCRQAWPAPRTVPGLQLCPQSPRDISPVLCLRQRPFGGRMRGAGGAAHLAGVRLRRRVMWTKGRPVPTAEHGVMAATLGQRLRLAVAHRAVEIMAN